MNATNDNQLETYTPFETVDQFIYHIVHSQRVIDLTFAQFLDRRKGFDVNRFTVPLILWIGLNELKKDEWFTLTDEIIHILGYKSSESNNNWKSLLRFIRKNFKEGTDFSEVRVGTAKSGSGGHNKLEVQMKKFPFQKILLKVGTDMSDAIHDSLITFEEAIIQYMTYR